MTEANDLNYIDVEIDEEDDNDGLPALEKKYQSRMRAIVSQRLDLPVSTLPTMLKEQIKINPDFQRRDRWDETRQSRLIESLVMNVPVPPVFLGEDEYGQYVVLDGRQRLTAISRFLSNELKLRDLAVWEELNGLTYAEMHKRGFSKYLTRRFLQAIVLLKESSSIVKYDVFERLNTGGIRANNMEIRNAIYRGEFTDLLHKLSRTPEFCTLWQIPKNKIAAEQNNTYKQMLDLELVLRFFALSEYKTMSIRFKDYLSEFMEQRNAEYEKDANLAAKDESCFQQGLDTCLRVFGPTAFVRGSGQRSAPLADAIMIACSDHKAQDITMAKLQAALTAKDRLLADAKFQKSIGTGTNGRGAIAQRIEMARSVLGPVLA